MLREGDAAFCRNDSAVWGAKDKAGLIKEGFVAEGITICFS